MTDKFIFWAQALDNVSPDHIDMYGKELSPDDTTSRQNAVSLVSGVVKVGSCLLEKQGFRLTEDGRHFVIEVLSAERDRAGRTAPIICYGNYHSAIDDALNERVAESIGHFARRIGRTILPEHLALLFESLAALKKKSWMRKISRSAWILVVTCILLALGFWLYSSGE